LPPTRAPRIDFREEETLLEIVPFDRGALLDAALGVAMLARSGSRRRTLCCSRPALMRGIGKAALFASALIAGVSPAQAADAEETIRADEAALLANGPTDIGATIQQSVLQPGAIFPNFTWGLREEYEAWKRRLWDENGLRFAFNYSQLYQYATDTLPIAPSNSSNSVWVALDMIWAPIDRGGPNQGSLNVTLAYRGPINSDPVAALYGVPVVGSLWSAYEWGDWDGIVFENIFWEQRVAGDFRVRFGNQAPGAIYNFSRFKDPRTSFTASPFAFHETIPYPAIGFGVAGRWQPAPLLGPYAVLTVNDMNADPQFGPNWSKVLSEAQFFYGAEFGYRWPEANGGFSHLHVDLFYADERALNPAALPNAAGGGFRVYGEKQIDRVVLFGGYTFNTARGGGIGATLARNTVTGGIAYLNPKNIRGEVALGLVWSQPFSNTLGSAVPGFTAQPQYGFEVYWRAQLTPNTSFTPGLQVIANPSFNVTENVIAIPSFKFRVSF
jgi:Carbohydrate-selective porin, OprB family